MAGTTRPLDVMETTRQPDIQEERGRATAPPGPGSVDDRLLDALVSVTSELELTQVLAHIVAAACELVDASYGALGVIGDDRSLIEFVHDGIDEDTVGRIGRLPEGHGILGVLIDDPRPLVLPDLSADPRSCGFPAHHPPMHGFLGVPIRVRGEVYGNLYLCNKTSGEVFSEGDRALVVALASVAGSAIANARLFDEGNRRERSLTALQGIATALLGGTSADDALRLIGLHARDILRADTAAIAVPTRQGSGLRVAVAVGEGADQLEEMVLPLDGSLSGEVFRTGRPAHVEDGSRDARMFKSMGDAAGAGPGVFVPLRANGAASGALAVLRMKGASSFTRDDIALLHSFAVQASLAMEYSDRQHGLHRLEIMKDEERIARDVHDSVVRRVFSVGLNLHGAMHLVSDPEVRQRVQRAIDELDGAVRDIRTTIFAVDREANGGPPSR